MAGEYYDHTTYPASNASGSSAAMRAELELIEAGFNKLPTLAGNAGEIAVVNLAGDALGSIAAGLTTEILVGGGAGAFPVWTTVTGTGAPVRATAPTLVSPVVTGLTETVYTITDGASVDLDPDNGGIQLWTLGANRTCTAGSFGAGQSMVLMVDDGTAYTLTFPTMTWLSISAVKPVLATSGYTVMVLWKAGSTLYGMSNR